MKMHGTLRALLAGAGRMHPWGEAQLLGPLRIAQASAHTNWARHSPKELPHGPCYS